MQQQFYPSNHINNPYSFYSRNGQYQDQRFFPLLPFVAGLAIGPLLFRPFARPFYPPYPPIQPGYPFPPYPAYPPYPGYPPVYGSQAGVTENINIYNQQR
ncbi:hypothetical protein [Bacillus sp. OV322]|uniref:hypothetical protein n=1 Tax=Bacillus sp. OV322 TaxID=1882764 RepID=UPI000B80B62C|nr:hypothetical protein [Bacillus sp. OV322]